MILLFSLLSLSFAADLPSAVTRSLDTDNRKAAAALLDDALADKPDTTELGWLLLYRAELERLQSSPDKARAGFESMIADHPTHPGRSAAALGIAVIDTNQNAMSGNSRATLESTPEGLAPATLDAERYLILARLAASEGDANKYEKYAKKAKSFAAGDEGTERRVAKVLGNVPAPEAGAAPAVADDLGQITQIRDALAKGDFAGVPRLVDTFKDRYPTSPYLKEAEYALRRAAAKTTPVRARVAVLLPLTGTYAPAARTVRAALEMGAASTGLQLEFIDTAGDPTRCVALLEKAVIDGGAATVLGPLLKEEAVQCTPAAQALRVPMITFTTWEDAALAGDQIFRPTPSTSELVTALLAETMRVRGIKRYAVLYPKNAYGENAAKSFEAQVLAAGGTISTSIGYDPDANDFRPVAKQLGKKDTKTRGAELARLRAASKDPDKVTLPPLIDYDAIFIPDKYKQVALLASALAFEEFPVGSFRPHSDSVPIPLLGLSGWNNDELVRRGGKYVQNSIFVDAFDAHNAAGASAFAERFLESTGAQPTVIEAVAYDTVRVLERALALPGDIPAALIAAELPDPVTGMVGFTPDRAAERVWRVLTVTSDGIVPLSAAIAAPE